MDSTLWYLVALSAIFALAFLLWALRFLIPNFRNRFVRHVTIPLIFSRGKHWDSITRLEGCLLFVFISVNLIMIFSPFNEFDLRQMERRAALAAAINLIPLSLGGRMGPVVEAFNIHRSTYLHLHHWIGRMAIIDGLIHAAIVISLKPRPGMLVTSGWVSSVAFTSSIVLSICLLRTWLGRLFLPIHRLMTLSGLAAMMWHVYNQTSIRAIVLVGVSCGTWTAFMIYRLVMLLGRRTSAEIIDISGDKDVLKIEVVVRKPVKVIAGRYFNIYLPGSVAPYMLLHGLPAVVFWHIPDDTHPCRKMTNLTFLVSRRGSHAGSLSRLQKGQRLLLEGPFGKNLKLETYENVILTAKGIGIAGLLPFALEISERKKHDDNIRNEIQSIIQQQEKLRRSDEAQEPHVLELRTELQKRKADLQNRSLFRDATKKIEIFWSLEDSSQMDVVQEQVRALQRLDPGNKLLVVWCGYPSPRQGHEPFKLSPFWMCLEPHPRRRAFDDLIVSMIQEERKKLQGSMVVTTCGSSGFTDKIRKACLECEDGMPVEFLEAEFRPKDSGEGNKASDEPIRLRRLRRS